MLAVERKSIILECLRTEGRVLVAPLSVKFGVSEETIRRDLEKLEREGYALRGYGGAVYNAEGRQESSFNERKITSVPEKERIAEITAALVEDGDYLMLNGSTTDGFIARALAGRKRLTIITNSIEIVADIKGASDWNILCTGGNLRYGVSALTGHHAEAFIRGYHVDKAIISCTALDMEDGCADAIEDNARVKRAMMDSADMTILACDSRKFGARAFTHVGSLDELSALVTNAPPGEAWEAALEEKGVRLYY